MISELHFVRRGETTAGGAQKLLLFHVFRKPVWKFYATIFTKGHLMVASVMNLELTRPRKNNKANFTLYVGNSTTQAQTL